MSRPSTWLLDFKADVHSQTGEDGIIEKILQVLPVTDKWCVELGAWDGKQFSTTRNLIENKAYCAVLIEGDETKFDELCLTYRDHKNVVTVNKYIGFSSRDGIDRVLERTAVPHDFDFLCIDVDGCDYHIWNSISTYAPKVVCIEFNPTIPDEVDFVQSANPNVRHGSSLSALIELGKRKDYELVAVLPFNAFFVKRELFPLFQIEDNRVEVLRRNREWITYIFTGYDGTLIVKGNCTLPWHGIRIRQSRIQHLPALLRRYPDDYSWMQLAAYRLLYQSTSYLGRWRRRLLASLRAALGRSGA